MTNNKNGVAVSVRNIHKEFTLPQNKNTSFKQVAVNIVRKNNKVTQKVLDGVSFEVKKGDFFGIVGRNGSGKSTLLRLIAGVYTPTSGSIHLNGGLTPFIELGVGFNPELSGRDNVFLNGALLGYDRREMAAMYDEIVAFAELEQFMDQKLKNYSSGMQVRLAFSIAIKADNDILMFDEVLAVGDSNFQEKCIRQFYEFRRQGKTVILVTHSMEMVEKFCNRVLLISEGRVVYDGEPAEAIDRYEALNMNSVAQITDKLEENNNKIIQISTVELLDENGRQTKIIEAKHDFSIKIRIKSKEDVNDVFVAVRVCESENQFPVMGFDNGRISKVISFKKGNNDVVVDLKESPLVGGKYYIVVGVYESSKREVHYAHYNGMLNGRIFLVKGDSRVGIVEASVIWPQ